MEQISSSYVEQDENGYEYFRELLDSMIQNNEEYNLAKQTAIEASQQIFNYFDNTFFTLRTALANAQTGKNPLNDSYVLLENPILNVFESSVPFLSGCLEKVEIVRGYNMKTTSGKSIGTLLDKFRLMHSDHLFATALLEDLHLKPEIYKEQRSLGFDPDSQIRKLSGFPSTQIDDLTEYFSQYVIGRLNEKL